MCCREVMVRTWLKILNYKQYTTKLLSTNKAILNHTFTPTVHPIVWGGRAEEEPLTIRWTSEVLPTPTKIKIKNGFDLSFQRGGI